MTNTVTTMADMSKACKEVINYCKSKAKKGIFYEGTLMNSVCWNAVHKMYSRRDRFGYSYINLTDEERAACNRLYKEVIHFLKARKNPKGYKEFMFNNAVLFITITVEPVAVKVPADATAEDQPIVEEDEDDLPPWNE